MSERVLVFGDDAKAFLGVVRSLGRRGIEVHAAPGDFSSPALASRYIAATHRLPPYSLGAERWAEAVREVVERERIGLVIPTSDGALLMLMRHADRLGRRRLALPSSRAAAIFTDKAETRRIAFDHAVPVCPGRLLSAEDKAGGLMHAFGLPLVLKPRRSWDPAGVEGKRPARIVRSREALEAALSPEWSGQWVVESFFPGVGVGVSVLARRGEILAAIQHRRLQEENETGPSTRRVTEPLTPRLLAWTCNLARASDLGGVAMFEYRWNPANDGCVLLEVNPRFWGSLPLALAAGADFPSMLYDLHLGVVPVAQFEYRAGVIKSDLSGEYCRLVDRIDHARSLSGRATAAAAAIAHIPRLLRKSSFDSWAKDDPEPFLAERRVLIARIRAATAKRLPRPALLRVLRIRQHLRRALDTGRPERIRLLVVGNANVCRSPFAEQLLQEQVRGSGGLIEIHSAGTLPLEDRAPPEEATAAAAQFGVDLSRHRSRSLTPAALLAATAVIVFDHATADRLRGIQPELDALVLRLPDLTDARDIVDATSMGIGGVVAEFRRISESVTALVGELLHHLPVS